MVKNLIKRAIDDGILDKFIVDPFNGVTDIERRIINTVGNPIDRFREDYLRMFRAYRFMATLKFNLHPNVREVIFLLAQENWEKSVSIERIKIEFDKCFEHADTPSVFIEGLRDSGLLKKIMPELDKCFQFKQNKYHKHDVYFHTINALNAVPKKYPLIRWAVIFHDLGKVIARRLNEDGTDFTFHNHEFFSVEITNEIMERMKFSNKDKEYIVNLIEHHMFQYNDKMKDSAIRRLVASLGEEYVDDLCIMKYADRVGKGKECGELDVESTKLKQRLKKIMETSKVLKIKDLAIDGHTVMKIKHISPSRLVGHYLRQLYERVIEKPELNTREQLEEQLKEL